MPPFARALAGEEDDRERQLAELGYFGAPFALIQSDGSYDAYAYRAPLVAERVDTVTAENASEWFEGRLRPVVRSVN